MHRLIDVWCKQCLVWHYIASLSLMHVLTSCRHTGIGTVDWGVGCLYDGFHDSTR